MTGTLWRTHRLELADQSLREWDTVVLAAGPDGIVLDSSAFYPAAGSRQTMACCCGAACRPGWWAPERAMTST
jgi:hypothetical protein